jgi:hypothetical protein
MTFHAFDGRRTGSDERPEKLETLKAAGNAGAAANCLKVRIKAFSANVERDARKTVGEPEPTAGIPLEAHYGTDILNALACW